MHNKLLLLLTFCIFLSGCDQAEKEARRILNEAIIEWNSGELESAEDKFELIQTDYADTKTATEAIKTRLSFKNEYKEKIQNHVKTATMKKGISQEISKEIHRYFEEHDIYPDNLEDVSLSNYLIDLAQKCTYKKSLFNYGYKLDCNDAEEEYQKVLKSQEVQRKKYSAKELTDFPLAKSTWGDKYNPSRTTPQFGYTAYYFDANNPDAVLANEDIDKIFLKSTQRTPLGIASKSFGAYWIGHVELDEDQIMTLSIENHHSHARVIINNRVVYGNNSKSHTDLSLPAGKHIIEVEFVNNSINHSTHYLHFKLNLTNKIQSYTSIDLKNMLDKMLVEKYDIYYVNVPYSARDDSSIVLDIEKTHKNIVLFLDSSRPVNWYISNPSGTKILAIVYKRHRGGTTIKGDIDYTTFLLPSSFLMGSHKLNDECKCSGGHVDCPKEPRDFLWTQENISHVSSAPITGFSGKLNATAIKVPEVHINTKSIHNLKQFRREREKKREECIITSPPHLMEKFYQGVPRPRVIPQH